MKTYRLVDLGTLDGVAPLANAINDAGVVVGALGDFAMVYNGTLRRLPRPPDALQAMANTIANRSPSLIAGFRVESAPSEEGERPAAALWQDGEFLDLHARLGAVRSGAEAVNGDGIVVGWADGKGFRFDTRTMAVEFLEAASAKAINASGKIVGITAVPTRPLTRAYLYDGTLHLLPTLGGDVDAAPIDINDTSVVVGTSYTSGQTRHAFRYDHARGRIDDMHDPAFSTSQAWSINAHGEVVGIAEAEGVEFGVIWRPREKLERLVDLVAGGPQGLTITRACDINGNGQIVASGRIGQQDRSFLLVPA